MLADVAWTILHMGHGGGEAVAFEFMFAALVGLFAVGGVLQYFGVIDLDPEQDAGDHESGADE